MLIPFVTVLTELERIRLRGVERHVLKGTTLVLVGEIKHVDS